jgi:hypothetical protein
MTLTKKSNGMDTAEAVFAGQVFRAASRHGVTMALARRLVAAGCADMAWQSVGADGRVRLCGPSLHRLARLTIEENDAGFRIRRWRHGTGGGEGMKQARQHGTCGRTRRFSAGRHPDA